MITIRKLRTLKPGTLRRKSAVILQAFENDLAGGKETDTGYLAAFLGVVSEAFNDSLIIRDGASELIPQVSGLEPSLLLRRLNRLRHLVLSDLGTEPADWDMHSETSPVSRRPESGGGISKGGLVEVFLDDIRSPFNIGSIFRTSEAFGVNRILLSPDCPDPEHPRAMRSAMGCTELVDWERTPGDRIFGSEEVCSGKKILFALELGGTPVSEFEFPSNGIAVVGSEELGISPEARAAALNSGGLVSIPVYGKKGSINVSVAFGIMMQRWSESLN